MEKVEIGTSNFSTVKFSDNQGHGGACVAYYICRAVDKADTPAGEFGFVQFQNGPIKEAGVNGCHHEDLLAIVIHRLQAFQLGDFKCSENALAIEKLEEATHCLNQRTEARQKRGIEGTSEV